MFSVVRIRLKLLALVVAGLGATAWFVASRAYNMKQRLNAKSTESWMTTNLAAVCESSTARNLADVLDECRRVGATCTGEDAWGSALIIEVLRPELSRGRRCRVISLGRDRQRGSCCSGSVGWNWDVDAVYEDGCWLQAWDFMAGRYVGPLPPCP